MNLLDDTSPQALASRCLKWDHQPRAWEPLPEEGFRVFVPPMVDYFQDPAGVHTKDNAPYLWLNVEGDFVARALVRPTFTTNYDAGAIMVRHDAAHWAKLCFERTDLGTTAVVSVVTKGTSDDANGVDLRVSELWLQIVRAGDVFGMHYGLDGSRWLMARLFGLAVPEAVRVGLVAQCPTGPGTTVDFLSFSVESRTVKNLRAAL